ncbi:hypothetical protein [Oceanicaulis sp.]|uniref:hypothetical protein n=1 Tax=Oceanicaulis sp. TaxID=1924941 RepID=UPI0025F75372|nr:hypothetical protein [Oceanicaulis sp.]
MQAIKLDLEDFTARVGHPFSDSALAGVLSKLPKLSEKGPWLAGGALRRTLLGVAPDSDFDFFFADKDQLDEFVSALPKKLKKVRETDHHVHYCGPLDGGQKRDVQAIRFRFYDDAASVLDSFDFTICQFAFDGSTLTTTPEALFDLGRKRLAVHKVTYPVATMRRLIKYSNQGFTACAGAMATLLRQTVESPEALEQLDIEYVD